MKKIILALVTLSVSLGVMARNEHIYVFRNDKNFNYLKGSNVKSIQYEGEEADGFSLVKITDADGEEILIDAEAVDSIQVATTALPEIHVNLQDHPEWTELHGLKTDVHPASLYIVGNGMMDDLAEQTVEFRGRGNSTWGLPKKPYRFKMEKKTALAGMKKAKTYTLIANYIDCSLMRNVIALWTADYLGMPYTNHFMPVRVYLNGILKGAYMLTEKIGTGGASVDIDENTGILFELDTNYDEDFRFVYDLNNHTTSNPEEFPGAGYLPVMVKDPDLTEVAQTLGITPESYLEEWQNDFSKMVTALMTQSEDLPELLDLESAADYMIVYSLTKNYEINHPKSVYMYKENREAGTKYKFGPVWDFDWAFTFQNKEGAIPEYPLVLSKYSGGSYFFEALVDNPAFLEIYKERWQRFVDEGYPELCKFMEEYADMIEPSAKENGVLWPDNDTINGMVVESSFDFREKFETLKKWLDRRVKYCNNHVNYGLY